MESELKIDMDEAAKLFAEDEQLSTNDGLKSNKKSVDTSKKK